MKLRKSAALLLAAFMIFTFSGVSAAEAQYQKEYNLLSDLKLLPADMTVKYIPAQNITRGSFAALLVNAVGYEKTGAVAGDVSPFADVKTSDANYKAIRLCSDFGIARGDGAGNFNPDRAVSGAEAVKMIMSALGYDDLAAAAGGYPTGYLVYATECKVLSGVSYNNDATITYGTAVKLIYNMLSAKALKSVKNGDGIYIDLDTDETVLSLYHNIKKYSGTVEGFGGVSLKDNAPEKGKVLIDGVYFTAAGDFSDFVGAQVYYYVEGDDTAVAAELRGSGKEEIVTSDEIVSFSGRKLTYTRDGAEKTASVSASTDVIYNGRPAGSSFKSSDFEIENGYIRLIDNNSDNVFETVLIFAVDNYVVSKIDKTNGIIYDKYDSAKLIKVNDFENVDFVDSFGNAITVDRVAEDDVISAMISKDRKNAFLYLSYKEFSGKVDGIRTVGDSLYFEIEGGEYKVCKNCMGSAETISIGTQATFSLDYSGYIADIRGLTAVKKWGFLVDAKEQKSIAGGVDIKIFDENGKMNILPAHTNVMCDGEKLSGSDIVSKLNSLKSTLVMFSETDDEIYEIDSDFKGENEEDFSVCKILEGTASMRWNRYQNVLGLKYPISDSAKIFSVPQTASDDNNDYSVKSVSSLLQDKFYTLTLYTLRGQGGQAKAAVMFNELKPSAISNGNMKAAVIDYVSKGIDEEGETTYSVTCLYNGQKVTYGVSKKSVIENLKSVAEGKKSETHTLARGDVIRFDLDDKNKISEIKLYYERETNVIVNNIGVGEGDTNNDRSMLANAYDYDDGVLYLTQDDLSGSAVNIAQSRLESIRPGLYNIYVLEKKNGELSARVGSVSDIYDYKTVGADYSKLFMWSKYGDPGVLLVFK